MRTLPALLFVALASTTPHAQDSATPDELAAAIAAARVELRTSVAATEAEDFDAARTHVFAALERVSILGEVHGPGLEELFDAIAEQSFRVQALDALVEARASLYTLKKRALPADDPELVRALGDLAAANALVGNVAASRLLFERVLTSFERIHSGDHPDLALARLNLASVHKILGDFAQARVLEEKVLATYEATLDPGAPELALARANYAATLSSLGELEHAHALLEEAVRALEAAYPAQHPELLRAQLNLAAVAKDLGRYAGVRELEQRVLAIYESSLPADHPDLARARIALAGTFTALGQPARARPLLELGLAARERTLAPEHLDIARTRMTLATCEAQLGDLERARARFEEAARAFERVLPDDNPELWTARLNLAAVLLELGELEAAEELLYAVASYFDDTPSGLRAPLAARLNLAAAIAEGGEPDVAQALLIDLVETCEELLPAGHPSLLRARLNLAATTRALGEPFDALAIEEQLAADLEAVLPADDPYVLLALANLLSTLTETYGVEDGATTLERLATGMYARFAGALASAPREARQIAGGEAYRLGVALEFAARFDDDQDTEFARTAFSLVETRRHVATAVLAWPAETSDSELSALREALARGRRRVQQVVLAGPADVEDLAPWRELVQRATDERDGAQRKLLSAARDELDLVQRIDARELAANLPPNSAAVGFVRVGDRMRAVVLTPAALASVVDLGPAERLEKRVEAWRQTLARPVDGRGVSVPTEESELAEHRTGRALRSELLDPVVSVTAGGTLFVCHDGFSNLVPLDALPTDNGERVGDVVTIRREVSFARLLTPPRAFFVTPGMLSIGAVDYDGTPAQGASTERTPPPLDVAKRVGPFGHWSALGAGDNEVRAIERAFLAAFPDATSTALTRERATKAALFEHAPGKRFLHVATHGWFMPEGVPSLADTYEHDVVEATSHVRGFAPMTLSGLCLAGANRGAGQDGNVPGLLTAEELATLDLSSCELAVLSACETGVGVHNAGEGVVSLQAALQAAGARASITSLWKVDDQLTFELMQAFYENLWNKDMPVGQALWAAKQALRDKGAPVSAWGGWVLTGATD